MLRCLLCTCRSQQFYETSTEDSSASYTQGAVSASRHFIYFFDLLFLINSDVLT